MNTKYPSLFLYPLGHLSCPKDLENFFGMTDIFLLCVLVKDKPTSLSVLGVVLFLLSSASKGAAEKHVT
jgi:hypothetical protein